MKYKFIVISIMLVLILGIFAGCTSEEDNKNGNGGNEENDQETPVGIIAFRSGSPGNYYIHLIDTDGNNEIRLSQGGEPMAWSPDGDSIAFINYNTDNLVIMNKDVTNEKNISIPSNPRTIDWSNDGKNILLSYGKIYDVDNEIEILDIDYY